MRARWLVALVTVLALHPAPVSEASTTGAIVSISEVYGGGGNTQATYRHDFVELHNRTRQPVDITGWRVEYSSATSTTWKGVALSGSIPAFMNYLVRMGSTSSTGAALPAPDATSSINIARSAGKIRLVRAGTVIDLVGYGSRANAYEGSAPAPGAKDNAQSVTRLYGGCGDTDRNDRDFKLAAASPRNRSMHGYYCGKPPVLAPVGDKTVTAGSTLTFKVSATDPDGDPLTYKATGLPSGASFSPSTQTFSWRPGSDQVRRHTGITFTVSDGYRTDSESIAITVKSEPAGRGSVTTLSVEQQSRQLAGKGSVSPNHAGQTVTVRLYRFQDGSFARVGREVVKLAANSTYAASFPRPAAGKCKMAAVFPGDADHDRSKAAVQTPC